MDGLQLGPLLGKGGFGEVRLGTLRTPGGLTRRVAVKLLHPAAAENAEAIRRLEAEAAMLASLNHPTVVTVDDLITLDGRIGLVMEYVPGEDLGNLAKRGELPLRPALEALSQVADALHVAWTRHGIIHRDIKANNIRLGPNARVKLLDFGIARSQERTALTAVGMVAGTRTHMAPERYDFDTPDTPASDVYALGCCMARLLTGATLWGQLNDRQLVTLALRPKRHATAVQKRLASISDPRLRELTTWMLSWDPEDRPTADQVSQALERAASAQRGPSLRTWSRERSWSLVEPLNTSEPGSNQTLDPRPSNTPLPKKPRTRWIWFAIPAAGLGLSAVCAALGGVALLAMPSEPVAPTETVVQPSMELDAPIQEPEAVSEGEAAFQEPNAALEEQPKLDAAPVAEPSPTPTVPIVQPMPQPQPPPAPPETDEVIRVEVSVSSVPMGMPITMDGVDRGHTPLTMELKQGAHVVSITTNSGAHALMLNVAPDQPTRHIWRERDQKWVQTD